MISRQPKGIPAGGEFAANSHDEASPLVRVGNLDAYRNEAAELLEAGAEIIGCSMSFEQEDGKLIASVYSDDGDIIERREVFISFGEPISAGRSANDASSVDRKAFEGFESDYDTLTSHLASIKETFPDSMHVEFTPETYWAARQSGITVVGLCNCYDGETGAYNGQPDGVADWMNDHAKKEHAESPTPP